MSDEIEILVKRIHDSIRPSALCRDCADCAVPTEMGDRCPNSGELCSPTDAARELSGLVYKLYTKLEGTQGEEHGQYVENLIRDSAVLSKKLRNSEEANAGLLQMQSEQESYQQRQIESLTKQQRTQHQAAIELVENISLIIKLHKHKS